MNKEKRTALLSSIFLVLISFSFVALALFSEFKAYYLCFFIAFAPAISNLLLALKGENKPDNEQSDKDFKSFVKKAVNPFVTILTILVIASTVLFYILNISKVDDKSVSVVFPFILMLIVIALIVIEQWCQYNLSDDEYYNSVLNNLRSSLALIRFATLFVIIENILLVVNVYNFNVVLKVILSIIFAYEILMMLVSLALAALKKELFSKPDLSIPKPVAIGKSKDLGLISYLEKNTGLTVRSLWSIAFVKNILPYALIAVVVVFWLCTGFTTINSYQKGILYRCGAYKAELNPGLHYTLPWPFDKVEIYDTDVVQEMTIGYISSGDTDNLWTVRTGVDEYKLLLGGGNELVSLNLKISYRINDVKSFALSSSSPEEIVQATAYNTITEKIINTDIDSLLATDRVAFSEDFATTLCSGIESYNTGIEIVSVVLESIHPPFEIAEVFQNLVGAEITATKYLHEAHGLAEVTLADANRRYDASVNLALSDQYDKIAKAKADVAVFMASVEADMDNSTAYRYYKYLNALKTAYGQSTLVIIGNGIDESNIYFGTIWSDK